MTEYAGCRQCCRRDCFGTISMQRPFYCENMPKYYLIENMPFGDCAAIQHVNKITRYPEPAAIGSMDNRFALYNGTWDFSSSSPFLTTNIVRASYEWGVSRYIAGILPPDNPTEGWILRLRKTPLPAEWRLFCFGAGMPTGIYGDTAPVLYTKSHANWSCLGPNTMNKITAPAGCGFPDTLTLTPWPTIKEYNRMYKVPLMTVLSSSDCLLTGPDYIFAHFYSGVPHGSPILNTPAQIPSPIGSSFGNSIQCEWFGFSVPPTVSVDPTAYPGDTTFHIISVNARIYFGKHFAGLRSYPLSGTADLYYTFYYFATYNNPTPPNFVAAQYVHTWHYRCFSDHFTETGGTFDYVGFSQSPRFFGDAQITDPALAFPPSCMPQTSITVTV